MPTRPNFKLEGFDAYLEELVRAGQDIDTVCEECLEVGSDILMAGMIRRASYSDRIMENIKKTAMMKDGNKRYLYIGVLRSTPAAIARMANANEFGGPGKENRKGRKHRNIQARPYIRPTLRSDAQKARDAMGEVFQEWLKK